MRLIDKSALVAEIEKRIKEIYGNEWGWAVQCSTYNEIISFINTLEVKESDLEEEIENYLSTYWPKEKELHPFLGHMAKYFFELGLKAAQKGE